MLQSEFVTTSQEFQNFRTVREMGIAHGIVVRSRSVVGSFFGGLQQLFGGNITIYTHLCEQARAEAFDKMMANAASLGANAVVGFRFESTELGQGLSEVLAYGTAVIIEAKR